MQSSLDFSGALATRKIRARGPGLRWRLANVLRWQFLKAWLGVFVVLPVARFFGLMTGYGKLEAVLRRANGEVVNFGVLTYRVVTTAFVTFLATQLVTDSTEVGDFKYHDSGVGTTAENAADTAMETTDGENRATGNQTNPTGVTYRSVGTISYTTTKAITEHGVFSQATGATLMDRSVFSAINVVSGDSIQFTYTLTLSAGG